MCCWSVAAAVVARLKAVAVAVVRSFPLAVFS
jgi:hypothetical protein